MRTPPQVTKDRNKVRTGDKAVGTAALVSPHMEVYWDDTPMGKNELAHEMYQIFENYERTYNDKACGSGAFDILETYNKNPGILDNLRLGVSYIAYEQTSAIRR